MGELLWAYGVVPAGAGTPAVAGVDDAPVTAVRHGELCALAGPVPAARFSRAALERALEDMETLSALARAHDRVLEAALEAGDVVPFPLCTIFETAEAVRAMLAAQGDSLLAALARVQDAVEWGVKGFAVARQEAVAAGKPASGAEYLARRRAERERAAAADDDLDAALAQAHAELAEHSRAAVLARPQDRRLSGRDTEMVLNGAYLVPRGGGEAFAALVEALDARFPGFELELTGPWPPYRFVGEARP
jgi:hypothetical protein